MVNRFTPKAQASLTAAKKCAERMGHSYIGSEHLILGILSNDCIGKKLLEDKKITYSLVYDKLIEIAGIGSEDSLSVRELTPKCKRVIEGSGLSAKRFSSKLIGTEHILYALCEEGESVGGRLLSYLGLNLQIMKNEIAAFLEREGQGQVRDEIIGAPILSAHGRSLNLLAKRGKLDPVIGRETELDRLIQILSRRTKSNPCLVGYAGVGKTAIVEGLAERIVNGHVPSYLADKTIVSLDLSSMIAGTKYRGEFEERMRGLLSELSQNDSIILFIDEIHTIVGAGGAEGAIDASNIIKPALARGQIQVIGATTTEEYRRYIEKDSALERRFQPVKVNEPTESEAITIIKGLRPRYEDFHKISIPDSVIEDAVRLSVRYIPDRYLPDKAVDVIDEGCSLAKLKALEGEKDSALSSQLKSLAEKKEEAILNDSFSLASKIRDEEIILYQQLQGEKNKKSKTKSITLETEDLTHVISQWTNIPVSKERKGVGKAELETLLKERIVGQDEAISPLAASVCRGCAGLKNPSKPIGSFLFLGPTGVGKTEMARVLSQLVFAPCGELIRLDMSEYGEKHSVSRLVGSPPGYVGYEEGGVLTKAVKQKPYSVVLFDEIEKAHPDIYNILLQILDSGHLTDAQGHTVSFKNTIVILTSNIGAKNITSPVSLGFGDIESAEQAHKNMAHSLERDIKREFRPELINRLDEIIVFNNLSLDSCVQIVRLMINDLCHLTMEQNISLEVDPNVCRHIAAISFNKDYGARPLKRAITKYIENPLSEKILTEEIKSGDSVSVFMENGDLKIGCKSKVPS